MLCLSKLSLGLWMGSLGASISSLMKFSGRCWGKHAAFTAVDFDEKEDMWGLAMEFLAIVS